VRILAQAGYRVLAAHDGEAALALARSHDGPIHGLLTDVVMPRVNGPQLAEALRLIRPGTAVLFMSGYAGPLMTDEGILPPGVTVLSKPFTKTRLLDAVAATLG
jgi:CheY-like chemotaxis protein